MLFFFYCKSEKNNFYLSSEVFESETVLLAKWVLVTFPDDPYTLSIVYAKILYKGESKRNAGRARKKIR